MPKIFRATVDWQLCAGCHPCLARQSCRPRAIVKIDADEPAIVDASRCNGCADCVPACSYAAISITNSHS